jgi:uncharacterized protein
MIDRVAATRRPEGKADGWQKWRKLLFVHWPVPVEALRRVVPQELELDLWEGTALVGVVPFAMHEVRPAWLPRAASFDFLETNVRTYVLCNGEPGVYFLSLEAESLLACAAARATFGLPYYYASMTMREEGAVVDYRTRRKLGPRAESSFRYRVGDALGPSPLGTLEHFLVERYDLFVVRGKKVLRGRVHHVPYPVHRAELSDVHDELIGAAGVPQPAGAPFHVCWSPGVDVEVFALKPPTSSNSGAGKATPR